MNKNNVDIDKLREGIFFAIRGGGIRSCASIGILKALEEANIPIKGVSGESGSSIVAALLSYGYNSDEILKIFLEYNDKIINAAKIYSYKNKLYDLLKKEREIEYGRGSIVIEESVNKVTNNIKMKDLPLDCWINAAQGNLLNPKLYLFNKDITPDETLGFAVGASVGLPVFYGNSYKYIDGKKVTLFDGGMLYNPYLPQNIEYPIIYSNFLNSVNYQKYIPFLQKPADAAMEVSDVIITTPVGNIVILASNEEVENLVETGYNEAKKVLYKK